jgi:hypothetical protein
LLLVFSENGPRKLVTTAAEVDYLSDVIANLSAIGSVFRLTSWRGTIFSVEVEEKCDTILSYTIFQLHISSLIWNILI